MTCECLYDVIGLSSACEGQERCSLYVDNLPGIERTDFEFLTSNSSPYALEVWDTVQKRAVESIVFDIQNAMSSKFVVRPIVEDIQTNQWKLPHVPLPTENKYKGVRIDLNYSRNLTAYISKVELYTDAPVSSFIRIFDLFTGVELALIPFTVAVPGFFEVEINQTFSSQSIGVFYDANDLGSIQTVNYSNDHWDQVCSPCNCRATHAICAEVETTDPVIKPNLSYTCGGMIVHYALHCSLQDWICRNKEMLKIPLWYLTGSEFFAQVLGSKRLNELTLIDSDRLIEIANYSKSKYLESLKAFADGAKIKDPVCVECKTKYRKKLLIN